MQCPTCLIREGELKSHQCFSVTFLVPSHISQPFVDAEAIVVVWVKQSAEIIEGPGGVLSVYVCVHRYLYHVYICGAAEEAERLTSVAEKWQQCDCGTGVGGFY